ncbi:HNH endonuclease signature motif containing protein [uncultured Paracoccus sp.]|uniref:HNH endonuclease n=1 Tax=uncultured Paracoccus sp. TaxID=189685 RepID=UPI00262DC692|nr:HNH endonuclease signature motif containing protein [uncultured Paracoccus sp.]
MGLGRFPRFGSAIYRTPQWKAVRLLAKRRDGWRCVTCGAKGRIEVDHIAPLRNGGAPYDLDNLQCLCPACHARKTRLEIGLGRDDPERNAWKNLLRDMQRNPSSNGEYRA